MKTFLENHDLEKNIHIVAKMAEKLKPLIYPKCIQIFGIPPKYIKSGQLVRDEHIEHYIEIFVNIFTLKEEGIYIYVENISDFNPDKFYISIYLTVNDFKIVSGPEFTYSPEKCVEMILKELFDMIKRNPKYIRYFLYPLPEWQDYVLSKNPMLINKIQNLHPKIQEKYQNTKKGSESGFF